MTGHERGRGLDTPVQFVKKVGPRRAELLADAGIHTAGDLLNLIPVEILDAGDTIPIEQARIGEECAVVGTVQGVKFWRHGKRSTVQVVVSDTTGAIKARFFNKPYMRNVFEEGQKVVLRGMVRGKQTPEFQWPAFEVLDETGTDSLGLVARYAPVPGMGNKLLKEIIGNALDKFHEDVSEFLPADLRKTHRLMLRPPAMKEVHRPSDLKRGRDAHRRFLYEDLLCLELGLLMRRDQMRKETVRYPVEVGPRLDKRIRNRLPFTLTGAQERVIHELRQDFAANHPMNRLLQGDVGSGKTVIAVYATLAAVANGIQAAIMAPTEILAQQHLKTFENYLDGSRVRIAYLGSTLKASERKETLAKIAAGEIDLVVGTHALVQKDVHFHKLGLVVIDEQHKFGVLQREALSKKGERLHTLVMTATPIPRTLTLTLFGDLDVSVIDEMPPGRQPIKTFFRPENRVHEAFEFIRERLREGRQAYFVYPIIEESESLPITSATENFDILSKVFSEYKVALLHGAMKSDDKDRVMEAFRDGDVQVLVSTQVVEVGVDVPNATVMVINHAERFGLSQLHQLRGRIGRGKELSYCILTGRKTTPEAGRRIQVMTETTDGFRIAEEDLAIRGPGDFLGVRQAGVPDFRLAGLLANQKMVMQARKDAIELLNRDPSLSGVAALKREVLRRYARRLHLATVG